MTTAGSWSVLIAGTLLAAGPGHEVLGGLDEGFWPQARPELVGVSPSGDAHVVRYLVPPALPGGRGCQYPPLGDRPHDGAAYLVCTSTPRACRHWIVHRPGRLRGPCTTAAEASAALREVDAAMAAAAIDRAVGGHLLAVERGRVTVSADVMAVHGLRAPLVVAGVQAEAEGEYRTVASAEGFGRVVLDRRPATGSEFIAQALLASDRRLLVVFDKMGCCPNPIGGGRPLRLDHAAARLLNDRGVGHHRAQRFGEAAADFAQALRLDPAYARAAFNLACAQARQQQFEPALQSLARALELEPATYRAKASRDPDLAALRTLPGFRALLVRSASDTANSPTPDVR